MTRRAADQPVTVGLAGDAMLGRGVGTAIAAGRRIVASEVVSAFHEVDVVILNLECCISDRGERWPDAHKPFFFRAPPSAVDVLTELGVDVVTLANNHALDFGRDALLDTFVNLDRAGIAWVGAGHDVGRSHLPVTLEAREHRLAVFGVSDHPAAFAAGPNLAGIAFADLWNSPVPEWLSESVRRHREQNDLVIVTPHWGPNMTPEPLPHVRAAATRLTEAGATLIAGHSAHVFQGVAERVLFDLGDFADDYAVDPALRNDMGLFWLVSLTPDGPCRIEAVPLRLEYCHTRLADPQESSGILETLRRRCEPFGTTVEPNDGRLLIKPGRPSSPAARDG